MREIWLVFRRELLERVRARTFLIGTLLFPLLMGALMFLPSVLERGELRQIVIVDETGSGVGQVLASQLGREPEDDGANRYEVEVIEGEAASHHGALNARVEADEIDGYLVVPADVFTTNRLRYRSTTIASPGMMTDIQVAASQGLRSERLRRSGIDAATIAAVVRPISVENARIGGEGEERGDAVGTLVFAYILAFVIYFMVFFYGVNVMRSVLEEKTSRIAEVLVSSLRSTHLMAGKIMGVACAALLQVSIWAAVIGLLVLQSDRIAAELGVEPETLAAVAIEPGTVFLLLLFFLLGFFLYASVFAALGAAVNSEQEAQAFQMVMVIPLIVPLLFLVELAAEPLSQASTFLGVFPLTSPVAMPMRLAAADIPPAEILLSLLLLAAALAATGWLAGKIYRIGILATGKRPTAKELLRWLRAA